MIKLYKGDCLELMKSIPNGGIDAIITDPPYEISNSGGGMMERGNRNFIKQIDAMGMAKSSFDLHRKPNSTLSSR